MTDIARHNRAAWDRYVDQGNRWSIPVSPEVIAAARRGEWKVFLTEEKPVPRAWFPDLAGLDVLCLASGGGQQAPILAAAGARVTLLDNSPKQLARDREVAARDGLELNAVEGDMRDLSRFADASFGLVFHPVSNLFVPDVRPVWREAHRVLRPGGVLLAGFLNPVEYAFDRKLADDHGIYQLEHRLPYSDIDSITEQERVEQFGEHEAFEFSHSLESQLGGQLEAGLRLTDLFEARRDDDPIARYMPSYIATRAVKPAGL